MILLERLRNAGISDKDIISTFQFKAGGYSRIGKRSYMLGNSENQESFWAKINFNKDGELFEINTGKLLSSEKSQIEFVENALNDIYGDHGYLIRHRILFSQKPLKGQKSPNYLIETNRYLEALDFYQWLLTLLLPHSIKSPAVANGQPKWTILQIENVPEYHLAYEAFNAHESDIETGENFSVSEIPNVARYSGNEDYYNHLWFQSSEIELPVEMEDKLHLFDNLPKESKENFRRSLYWFNVGSKLYNQEQLSIIPFSIAIECLLPNPSNEVCPTCTKPLGDGPTKLFKDFMEKKMKILN